MPVVTIRGQLGSGAPEIGRLIAASIGADYVDREIIAEVATRVQRDSHEVLGKEEPPVSLLGRIMEALGHHGVPGMSEGLPGAYLPTWEIPLGDARYVEGLTSVIKELARSPSIVIRGRGSQFILKDHSGAVHVLVVAPLAIRVERVMNNMKVDEESARGEIDRVDSSRRAFIKRYFQAELEDPVHHDLVINTGRLSFETAAQIVVGTLQMAR